jgi:hypothetical protein
MLRISPCDAALRSFSSGSLVPDREDRLEGGLEARSSLSRSGTSEPDEKDRSAASHGEIKEVVGDAARELQEDEPTTSLISPCDAALRSFSSGSLVPDREDRLEGGLEKRVTVEQRLRSALGVSLAIGGIPQTKDGTVIATHPCQIKTAAPIPHKNDKGIKQPVVQAGLSCRSAMSALSQTTGCLIPLSFLCGIGAAVLIWQG